MEVFFVINLKEEKAFTLVEVVASIVIITIVLLSFAQIFIQTNKTAHLNNEKLVVVNLADAVLERERAEPRQEKLVTDLTEYFNSEEQKKPIVLNGKRYTISYAVTQQAIQKPKNSNFTEKELNLIKLVVTVTAPNGKTKGSSEGYVFIEKKSN